MGWPHLIPSFRKVPALGAPVDLGYNAANPLEAITLEHFPQ